MIQTQKRIWQSINGYSAALLLASVAGVFVLQPAQPIPALELLFPLGSLGLVLLTWFAVRSENQYPRPEWAIVAGGLVALVTVWAGIAEWLWFAVLSGMVVWALLMSLGKAPPAERHQMAGGLIWLWVGLLVALKLPLVLGWLRDGGAGYVGLQAGIIRLETLQWIGISYITLRMVAVLLDFRAGRLPDLSLSELLIYALFPPSLLAGPIDRAGRFRDDLRAGWGMDAERLWDGGTRILVGALKKFVIADTLALVALSGQIAPDVDSTLGAWVVVYLYALRIFFDFSGYSDMAIGLGIWLGIRLPENFNYPYFQSNLTQFWQNWHMTLTGWFRAYVFMPLSRWLLRRNFKFGNVLICQLVTMSLIGAWHGITVNFLIWGAWHAVGLTVHRAWTLRTRGWMLQAQERPWLWRTTYAGGWFVTFHYVVVGWVFFALPTPDMALAYLRLMFGA